MRFTVHDFQVQNSKRHFFFTGAAGAIIGALGSMYGANKASKGSSRSYDDMLYDVNMTQAQWKHDEYMANSAHQREVADLRSAGLNPVLSATGGSGAATTSTPVIQSNSASASVSARQQAKAQQLQAGLQVFGDILQAQLKDKELNIASKNADTNLMNAVTQSKQTDSNTALQNSQIANYVYQNRNLSAQEKLNLAKSQEANAHINFMNLQGNSLAYQNSLNSALAQQANINSHQIGTYGPHTLFRTGGALLEDVKPYVTDQAINGYVSSIINGVKNWFESLNSAKSTNQATRGYLRQ
nr:MAG TPA: minor capsid protein [Microviridae sp.]